MAVMIAVLVAITAVLTIVATSPGVSRAVMGLVNNVLTSMAAGICVGAYFTFRHTQLDYALHTYIDGLHTHIAEQWKVIKQDSKGLAGGLAIDIGQLASVQEATVAELRRLRGVTPDRDLPGRALSLSNLHTELRTLQQNLPDMIQKAVNEAYAQGAVDTMIKARTPDRQPPLRPVN